MPAETLNAAHSSLGAEAPELERVARCTRAGVASGPLAVALAAVGVAGFVWSGSKEALPALQWAAPFLFLLVAADLRYGRIPNWLTLPSLGFALALAFSTGGGPGALIAFGGALAAFAVLLPLFVMGGMGAGDIKGLMVLGALWGPVNLLGSLGCMLLAGGAFAVALLLRRRLVLGVARAWATSILALMTTGKWVGGSAATQGLPGLPFGAAIVIGASVYQLLGAGLA
jgi:prepilin peptidase CpaA